jgi:DNA repair protein RadC
LLPKGGASSVIIFLTIKRKVMEHSSKTTIPAKAAEVYLAYKTTVKPSERPFITNARDCYELLMQHWDDTKIDLLMEFKIVLLNQRHRVLGICEISQGGIARAEADVRLVMAAALKANAVAIILVHNYPSGNTRPSESDKDLTKRMKEAGVLLRIRVIDHIIVSREEYFSFADEGLL